MKSSKKKAVATAKPKFKDLKSKKNPKGGSVTSVSDKVQAGWVSKVAKGWIDV